MRCFSFRVVTLGKYQAHVKFTVKWFSLFRCVRIIATKCYFFVKICTILKEILVLQRTVKNLDIEKIELELLKNPNIDLNLVE